jgi:hypothetical protein
MFIAKLMRFAPKTEIYNYFSILQNIAVLFHMNIYKGIKIAYEKNPLFCNESF